MASPIHNTFIRRPSGHRTTETTCSRCLLTIASAKREAELEQAEERHICDPWLLEQWKQIFEHNTAGQEDGHSGFPRSRFISTSIRA